MNEVITNFIGLDMFQKSRRIDRMPLAHSNLFYLSELKRKESNHGSSFSVGWFEGDC